MNKQFMNSLTDYVSTLAAYLDDNMEDSLEKTTILQKCNELVFWLEMYYATYIEDEYIEKEGNKYE